jgi:hypothetical protein
MYTVEHEKYGRVRVLRWVASDRGGLALIITRIRHLLGTSRNRGREPVYIRRGQGIPSPKGVSFLLCWDLGTSLATCHFVVRFGTLSRVPGVRIQPHSRIRFCGLNLVQEFETLQH